MQELVVSMRETMPFFVSSVRGADGWKRSHAKRAAAIIQAEREANATYVKSTCARSMNVDDLLRYLDDTVLDINLMVQLPSIEQCLEKWWQLYASGQKAIDQEILRSVYQDLAFVLVEAKTETLHTNAVSMIMRSSWTKWSAKESPLSKSEFFRLLFILAHLMTSTDRLDDYIVFFHDTMSKIAYKSNQKQTRTEQHSRPLRTRRKFMLEEMHQSGISRQALTTLTHADALSNHVLKVHRGRQSIHNKGFILNDEDEREDCFVELLERNARYQRVAVDPLLHDRKFQEKFRLPGGRVNLNTMSTNDMLATLNPVTNRYCPPLHALRLRTRMSFSPVCRHQPSNTSAFSEQNLRQPTASDIESEPLSAKNPISSIRSLSEGRDFQANGRLDGSQSTPVIGTNKFGVSRNTSPLNDMSLTPRENELMRRSLSRVSLKARVDQNKAAGAAKLKNRGYKSMCSLPKKEQTKKKDVYLAIST